MAGDDRAVVRLGPLSWRISTAVYSTIIALAALAVWDEPADELTLASAAYVLLVVAGPVAALATAHMFADLAHEHIALGRAPHWSEVRQLIAVNAQYLLIVLPAAIIVMLSLGLTTDTEEVVALLFLAGIVSLFVWGGVVAVMTKSHGWLRVLLTVGYGSVGCGIVLVETALTH